MALLWMFLASLLLHGVTGAFVNVALGTRSSCAIGIGSNFIRSSKCPRLVDGDFNNVSEFNHETKYITLLNRYDILLIDINLPEPIADPTIKIFGTSSSNFSFTTKHPGRNCGVITLPKTFSSVEVTCPETWSRIALYSLPDVDFKGTLSIMEIQVLVCSRGTYGDDCTKSCSSRHCVSMTTCPRNGACSDGCVAGWTGMNCRQTFADGTFGPRSVETSSYLILLVGSISVLGVLLLMSVIGNIVLCVLRKNRTQRMTAAAEDREVEHVHGAGDGRHIYTGLEPGNREDPPVIPSFMELRGLADEHLYTNVDQDRKEHPAGTDGHLYTDVDQDCREDPSGTDGHLYTDVDQDCREDPAGTDGHLYTDVDQDFREDPAGDPQDYVEPMAAQHSTNDDYLTAVEPQQ